MRRNEAIKLAHAAMDEIAQLGQEIDALDILIFRFGQARYYNPEMVRRLSRAKARLEAGQEEWRRLRDDYAKYIDMAVND